MKRLWAVRFFLRRFSGPYLATKPGLFWIQLITWIGFVLGVFAWLLLSAVMNGLQGRIKERLLAHQPHWILETKPEVQLRKLAAELAQKKPHWKVHGVLSTEGLLETMRGNQIGRTHGSGVVVDGVDFPISIDGTSSTLSSSNRGDAIPVRIGSELGAQLGVWVGERLALRSPWRLEGRPLIVEVAEVVDFEIYEKSLTLLQMPRSSLESWLGLGGAASRIEIFVPNPHLVDLDRAWLEPLGFLSWQETHGALWHSLKIEKTLMSLAMFFVLLLSVLSVFMSVSLRIGDQTKSIGVLRALGISPKNLRVFYMLETFSLTVVATILGTGFAWVATILIKKTSWFRLPELFYSTEIPVAWDHSEMLILMMAALILGNLAAWIPLRRLEMMSPIDLLR